jgi:hypothetical protein
MTEEEWKKFFAEYEDDLSTDPIPSRNKIIALTKNERIIKQVESMKRKLDDMRNEEESEEKISEPVETRRFRMGSIYSRGNNKFFIDGLWFT